MLPPVRISDIGLYLSCPRLVYFDNLGGITRKNNAEQILLRSLVLSLSQKSDLEAQLKEALARLEEELPIVYEIEPGELGPACREMEEKIALIAQGLSPHCDRLFPCEAEVDLRSEKLGLSGRLDRLAPGFTPSLIRTGQAPEDGVWKKDRIMLAGYGLLLGERHNLKINQGLVEYPRSGIVRHVQIHSVDKARVLRIRDRVRQIKEGRLPDLLENARCDKCAELERCEMKQTLASRFF
jgi:CRISPR-associated exonuclease Cas4